MHTTSHSGGGAACNLDGGRVQAHTPSIGGNSPSKGRVSHTWGSKGVQGNLAALPLTTGVAAQIARMLLRQPGGHDSSLHRNTQSRPYERSTLHTAHAQPQACFRHAAAGRTWGLVTVLEGPHHGITMRVPRDIDACRGVPGSAECADAAGDVAQQALVLVVNVLVPPCSSSNKQATECQCEATSAEISPVHQILSSQPECHMPTPSSDRMYGHVPSSTTCQRPPEQILPAAGLTVPALSVTADMSSAFKTHCPMFE